MLQVITEEEGKVRKLKTGFIKVRENEGNLEIWKIKIETEEKSKKVKSAKEMPGKSQEISVSKMRVNSEKC